MINQKEYRSWDQRPVAAEAATEIGFEEIPLEGVALDSYSVECLGPSVEIGKLQLAPVSLLHSAFRRSFHKCPFSSYLPHKPLSLF